MGKPTKRIKLSPYASTIFQKKTGKKYTGTVFKMSNLINALPNANKARLTKKQTRTVKVTEIKRNMPSRATKSAFLETMKKAHNNKVKAAENRKKFKENMNNLADRFGKMNTKLNSSH